MASLQEYGIPFGFLFLPARTLCKHCVHSTSVVKSVGDMHALVGYLAPKPVPKQTVPLSVRWAHG